MSSERATPNHLSVKQLFFLLIALFLSACGKDEMRWKEQVYLHDGSLVEVDRYAIRKQSGFPNTRRGPILKEELRYSPLGVVWNAQSSGEELLSFDIVNGTAYVVAIAPVNRNTFCAGKPVGEYVANYYRWIGGRQEKVTRDETPVSIMRWNLTGINHWGHDRSGDRTYFSWTDVMYSTHQYPKPMLLSQHFANNYFIHCH